DKELKADNIDNPLTGVRFIVEAARGRDQPLSLLTSRDPQADLDQVTSQLRTLESRAQADDVRTDPDRMKILDQVATILGLQLWKMRHRQAVVNFVLTRGGALPEDLYFGGTRKPDDLLDFLLGRQHADRLGIILTDADVRQQVEREAAGAEVLESSRFADNKRVKVFLRGREHARTNPKELLDALRDEFRV